MKNRQTSPSKIKTSISFIFTQKCQEPYDLYPVNLHWHRCILTSLIIASFILVSCNTSIPSELATPKSPYMQNTSNPIEASSTPSQPTSTQISSDKSDTTWVTPVVAENMECNIIFPQHELREPYQRNKGQPRYTLSNDELNNLLKIMAIDSLCIHSELGDPFINTDWNSQDISAATGHMLSLGFENLYHGAGWSDGYMLYSTYDFSMGTAYDSFATREDFQAVMEKSISNLIHVNGVPGFIRYQEGLSLGLIPIYKAYIFPFEDFYTAVVYGFGPFEWEQVDIALARLQTGEVPNEHSQDSNLMDVLALSIQFLHSP